jgi:hypothetical protein
MRPAQCGSHCATGQVSRQVVRLSQLVEKCDIVINAFFSKTKRVISCMHSDCICSRFNYIPCRPYYVGRLGSEYRECVRNTVTCVYWGPDTLVCHRWYTKEIIFHLVSNISCTSYRSLVFMSLQNALFGPEFTE